MKHKISTPIILSISIAIIGLILLIFMIIYESEPGLLPLVLVALGTISFLYLRNSDKSKSNEIQ